MERFDPAWRSTILSAAQGAVLGPLPGPDGFTLAIVDEKVPASARHGSRIDALLAVIEEAEREEILISRRDKIRDRDHRFLLALLINLSDRDTILSRIAETYETADPGALVLKWLSDLSGEHNLGIEIDDLNALLLQHLLAGLSFEEICDRVSSEFSPEEVAAQALELHEHCERLRNHAPLRPLLNAIR